MRIAAKGLLLGLSVMAVAAWAASGSRMSGAHQLTDVPETKTTNVSYRLKNHSRVEEELSGPAPAAMELAQLGQIPGWPGPGPLPRIPLPPAGIAPTGLLGRAPPPLSPRQACEEEIARGAAFVAYLKVKVRLQGAQQEAWENLANTAAPAVQRLYDGCAELPERIAARPSMPDAISFAEKRFAAAAELFRVISKPLYTLYEMLSPDQRAVLDPPPPPPPPM
jgi:LTXXQ motif family protein